MSWLVTWVAETGVSLGPRYRDNEPLEDSLMITAAFIREVKETHPEGFQFSRTHFDPASGRIRVEFTRMDGGDDQ